MQSAGIRGSRTGGFALLITITLLAFLVLLLVSLAALTRVETQVASNNQQLSQARQHALMALNIALGELQKHAGPDQRVTAEADVLASYAGYPNLPTSVSQTAGVQAEIDTFWNGQRHRHWTGVWENTNTAAYSAANPAASNAIPGLKAWLVSGNERTLTFTPDMSVSGLSLGSTATDEIKDAAGNSYRLLVGANSTAAVDPAADVQRLVVAPQVSITSTNVPGVSGPVPVGNYAWWVGDEGVKARANLRDRYDVGNPTDTDKRKRLQSAQRVAIEAMSVNGSPTSTGNASADGLAPYSLANAAGLDKAATVSQLGFLNSDTTFQTQLKARFHDLTTTSRGVLADVKNGGLKHDLSYLLSRPTEAEFRTALNAALPGAAPNGTYNPILSTVTTPYAALPSGSFAGMLDYSATWEQLWSFHNMGNLTTATPPAGVFNTGGQAVPRLHAGAQHGISPLLVQGKLFYNLRNEGGTVWVEIIPIVVLANPYGVNLAPADYYFEFTGLPLIFQTASAPYVDGGATGFNASTLSMENGGLGQTVLVVRTSVIPAGEARIYSLSPEPAHNPGVTVDADGERVEFTGVGAGQQAVMTEGYDKGQVRLTFNTGRALTGGLQARLKIPGNTVPKDPRFRLYLSSNYTQHANLAHQGHRQPVGVNPFNDKIMVGRLAETNTVLKGGGIYFAYEDGTKQSPSPWQQAPFYQINYRGLLNEQHGPDRPFMWGSALHKEGKHPPLTPNLSNNWNWIDAHLASADSQAARWGLAFRGKGSYNEGPPTGFEDASANPGYRAVLYDIPGPDHPPVSLGQLQHFNTTGHIPPAVATITEANTVHCWQVNYALGNSYPHHRVEPEQVMGRSFTTDSGVTYNDPGFNYDGSYLWNDALWDRFTFSSYPGSDPFDFAADTLINDRYRPFRDRSVVAWDNETQFRGDSRSAAKNLLVEGAFNINSTSLDAWKAVFSSLKNVPVGADATPSAPFARTLAQTGGSAGAENGVSANAWTGFRNLSTTEVNALAAEMVMQVRKRGPFLSMADFVNRRLGTSTGDTYKTRLMGALQAAIDGVINTDPATGNTRVLDQNGYTFSQPTQYSTQQVADQDGGNPGTGHFGYLLPSRLAGFPGYLLQGDVLSALAPSLTARSDTFTIRTYGDVVNPVTGEVTGRAWCEAIVQRTPDYVVPLAAGGNAPDEIPVAGSTNANFGRRYEMISFRWLNSEDI